MKGDVVGHVIACVVLVIATGTGCSITNIKPQSISAPAAETRLLALGLPRASTPGCPEGSHEPWTGFDALPVVDSLPVPLRKVAPHYPDLAREQGVDGIVMVAALICEHGHVVETRIAASIPMLDVSSQDAVDQWTFRPAIRAGRAISYWFKTPVRYSLH